MALPGNITVVTLTGRYVDMDGLPIAGKVSFTLPSLLIDGAAKTIIVPRTVEADLVNGEFTKDLPACDDPDVDPTGFTILVNEQFDGASGRQFSISLPMSATEPIDISQISPVAPVPPVDPSYATLSALAAEATDRQNAIDSAIATEVIARTAGDDAILAKRGAANGLAPLDAGSKLPLANMPWLGGIYVASDAVGIFSVIEYGAEGDGVTNDAVAIQAAFDAAHAAGGGVVVFAGGKTYSVSSSIQVWSNTTVLAYGATIKAIGTTNGILRNFVAGETYGAWDGHGNIVVLGGIWDGNAASAGVGTVTGNANVMSFVHAGNVTIRDVTITNVSSGGAIVLTAMDAVQITNCHFNGFVDNSGGVQATSECIIINFASVGQVQAGLADNTACRNIRIEGCYFSNSARLGHWGRCIGSWEAIDANTRHSYVQVIGNRIANAGYEGVRGYAWQYSVIKDNIIFSTGSAIIVGTPNSLSLTLRGIDIEGNTITGIGSNAPGISIEGRRTAKLSSVRLIGNSISGASGEGIYIQNCDAPALSGNVVDSVSGVGIYAIECDYAAFTGNTIKNTGGIGMNVTGCPSAVITGNSIATTNNSSYGIFIGRTGDALVFSKDVVITGNKMSGTSNYGIRLSLSATGCFVANNQVRKDAGATPGGISIDATAIGCTVINNDFGGNAWTLANAMTVNTALPTTGSGGMKALPGSNIVDGNVSVFTALEAEMRPASRYETTSRLRCGTSSTAIVSGTLYLVPIWLPAGLVVSNLNMISGATAVSVPTNWWFSLHDSTRKMLAVSADQTTTAWAVNQTKVLAVAKTTAGVATTYTTTYTGLHYFGFMIKATTTPALISEGSLVSVSLLSQAPGLGDTNVGQTTPPDPSGAGFTAAAFGAFYCPLVYAWVS